jgi:two-component system phosphate regulon response regulator PhoB
VRAIGYQFDSFEAMADVLESADGERELVLPPDEELRDGQWLLATFNVGADSTAVAGRVLDCGDGLRLWFEDRDWGTICRFARAHCCACAERSSSPSLSLCDEAVPRSTVLVIDDDLGVQTVVSATLRASGFCACSVGSAEEALDFMRSEHVDLIVLDWALPGMTGPELCRRLRKDRRHSHLPVLFLTARASDSDVDEAMAAGASDFVSKPFRAPELGCRVLSLLRRMRGGEGAASSFRGPS